MKWFKHLVESGSDPDIQEAIELFGFYAYYVFFRCLEIMAREFDVKKPGFNDFSIKFFAKKFEKPWPKTRSILLFFHQKKRIFLKFYIQKNGRKKIDRIMLNCPKLKKLCDEYTSKIMKKKSGSKSGSKSDKDRTNQNPKIGTKESDYRSKKELKDKESGLPDFKNKHYEKNLGNHLLEIKEKISQIERLIQQSKWQFNVHAWVQIQVNESKHPRAISETLGGLIKYWHKIENGPWNYADAIMITKSPKYHEQDHIRESKDFKNIWISDPEIKQIIEGIF